MVAAAVVIRAVPSDLGGLSDPSNLTKIRLARRRSMRSQVLTLLLRSSRWVAQPEEWYHTVIVVSIMPSRS